MVTITSENKSDDDFLIGAICTRLSHHHDQPGGTLMQRIRQIGLVIFTALLVAALASPALAWTAPAGPAPLAALNAPSFETPQDYVNWLRHSVGQSELEAEFEQTAAWLDQWMAQRPPVDLARQAQTTAKWTVMVHVAADNNLEIAGLMDVNEMEAIGSTPDVNVVVQLDRSAEYADDDGDWTETRRYYIQQDNDPRAITSPVIENLGETDSGDPDTLADFAIWAITNYPAEKYMLVLWDHGGAWISHSSDEDTGSDIDLPEFTAALDRVRAETGIEQFEVIGFDMCLMAQFEVMNTITPYAKYGIGSEENEPGAGWFYLFLEKLVQDPAMDGGQLGQQVVDYFMYFLREVIGDQDVYSLATVDLSQSSTVAAALTQFTATVSANPAAALSPIADARNNVISYGGFNDPQIQDIFSSVDLYQLAELVKSISGDPALQDAAQGVMDAVDAFVIYEDHQEALEGSHGTSIYFPRTFKNYKFGAFNERYPGEAPASMAAWVEFLNVFHGTATSTVTSAPQINIAGVYPDVVSIHNPAVITLEVTGRDILRVNYAVTYNVSENERAVLDFDYLVSRTTTASGANIVDWSDGVTQRVFSWEAEVPVLTDGATRTYALLIPNLDNPNVLLVNGLYTPAAGGDSIEARLLFDVNTRTSTALWGLNETDSGSYQPFELQVASGDTFQPLWLTLDANYELAGTSLGDTLYFEDSVASIYFEKIPAPSGTYSISFVAENVAGDNNLSEAVLTVNNDGLDEGYRGYTDLTYGVNFRYPANWIRPRFTPDGTRLFTAEMSTVTVLSLYPYTDVTSAEETDAAIRASWNELQDLQIQQQRSVEINGLPAYVTDYTYTYEGEARIGAVIAIYVPSQNVGYAFDLEGPAANPGPAQQALQALVESINFLEPQQVSGDTAWQTVAPASGQVSFPVPSNWTQETSEGWTLYGPVGNEAVFVALASAPTSGQANADLANDWAGQLQSSVSNLTVLASEPYYIGGLEWHVIVFTYDGDVKMAGAFFTTTNVGGQDYIFWIEAPDADFDQLYSEVFSVIIGGFKFGG
jgi:hypothetical protein